MRKFLLMGLTILLLIAIAGCGGAAERRKPLLKPPRQP